MTTPNLSNPPPTTPTYLLSYPTPHTLLITINRPRAMNSLPYASHWEADTLLQWFDGEPALRVAIVTGAGDKAFCAGQDLIEQGRIRDAAEQAKQGAKGEREGLLPPRQMLTHPPTGFMGVSRRMGKKPVIAAVNGFALGGGFEIVLNCDLIVASPRATFGLPEASRGLYAAAGGLPRLVRTVGLPLATEIAMAGRVLSAAEARQFGLVNIVAASHEGTVEEAVQLAGRIAALSPDAVVVTRHGLRSAWEEGDVEKAVRRTEERYSRALREGENIRVGLRAFKEKRRPDWVPSKL